MDIYLSVNNREEVIKLPVVPSSFTITKPRNNKKFETVSGSELKRIGVSALKGITIESFFPVRDYPFLRDRTYKGQQYVYIIDTWVNRRLPIRLIITDTPINMAVSVENFEYTIGQDSNLNYVLTLEEFPIINVTEQEQTTQTTTQEVETINASYAIAILADKGIINTPDIWYQGTWNDEQFKTLFVKMAAYIANAQVESPADAVAVLTNHKIINTPQVWYEGTWTDENFKTLLVKVATYIITTPQVKNETPKRTGLFSLLKKGTNGQ